MSRSNSYVAGSVRESLSEKGTGDGETPLSSLGVIKSEDNNKRDIIMGNRKTAFFPSPVPSGLSSASAANDAADFERHIASLMADRPEADRIALERFLRANPGMTVRDWKGKGPSVPMGANNWDKPWHRLRTADVREEATRAFARELPQNVRQAAARDRGLIWNDLARKYRLRLPSDPLPGLES